MQDSVTRTGWHVARACDADITTPFLIRNDKTSDVRRFLATLADALVAVHVPNRA